MMAKTPRIYGVNRPLLALSQDLRECPISTESESSPPVHVDQRVKHVCRPCATGGIEASGEPSDFDGFGD